MEGEVWKVGIIDMDLFQEIRLRAGSWEEREFGAHLRVYILQALTFYGIFVNSCNLFWSYLDALHYLYPLRPPTPA